MHAGPFVLTRYLRRAPGTATLVVYLEGDARAWHADGVRVTATPPPVAPLALELAAVDPAPAVAWLGRPCQLAADATACEPSLWSRRRFSGPVVSALDAGLDALRAEAEARQLELVGYSGGGVLAVLLAARRDDVVRVVTVAAPLDLAAWTAHHGLAPLEARSPAELPARALDGVAQHHLVGERDEIVPPAVLDGYARRFPAARVEVVPGRDHGDWRADWAERIAAARRD